MNQLSISTAYDATLESNKTRYSFTNKKTFSANEFNQKEVIKEVFNFAWGMSFGNVGEHRNHRSGGTHHRKNGEIFANTFQGKMAEFTLFDVFCYNGLVPHRPDTEMYELGVWDSSDLNIQGIKISIKSTKSFGQLLLLETKDWNEEGMYIPNIPTGNSSYDAFVLVRFTPDVSGLLKQNRWLYKDTLDEEALKNLIMNQTYSYDIPGYVPRTMLVTAIKEGLFLPKGSYLGNIEEGNKMDADNYYVQTGDMLNISSLIELIRNN